MYDPSRGSIEVDGIPLSSLEPHFLRRRIGFVGQEPRLFSGTISENITYGHAPGSVSREDVEAACRLAQAHDFIMSLPNGYDTVLDDTCSRLSGGQKQRIAIARAVLGPGGQPPPILLLDEPTSALDAESEAQVQAALASIMHGRTCLIIAHRLSTIRAADQICVLHAGRVVERGSHAALLARGGFYSDFVRLSGGAA
jgi:ABC-type multidrug transport system fused ATPase/permease subunit